MAKMTTKRPSENSENLLKVNEVLNKPNKRKRINFDIDSERKIEIDKIVAEQQTTVKALMIDLIDTHLLKR